MNIRPADQADLPTLLAIQRDAVEAGYPSPLREKLLAGPGIGTGELQLRWRNGDVFLVAEDETGIAGYGSVALIGAAPEITALFVRPTAWRGGTGSGLVEAIVGIAVESMATRLVVKANPNILGFYAANGFALMETQVLGGMAVPIMARELAGAARDGARGG